MFKYKSRTLSRGTAILLAATMVAASFVFAGSAQAASKKSLTILVEGGGKAELQPIADLYKKKTGTSIKLVELPYSGLYDRIQGELGTGKVSFDITAVDAVWLSAFKDGLMPLDKLFTPKVKADIFPGLLAEGKIGTKNSYGMPFFTNSEIVFYRTDLFNDSKNKADFKAKYGYALAAPTTWDQYKDIAQFFTRDTNGDGKIDLYGTDVKAGVETEWLATVSQAGEKNMILNPSTKKVTIDSAAHLKALDFYTSLLPYAPPGAAQIDWGAGQNLFYQGTTAMMRFWGHAYPQTPKDSVVYGKVGVAPMIAGPGGIAGIPGAWYLSIPKVSKTSADAMKFIAFAQVNNALSANTSLGLVSNISAFKSQEKVAGRENYSAILKTLNSPATFARPATPKWQEIVDTVLTPLLQKAVEPGANNAALLKAAKTQIEGIIK